MFDQLYTIALLTTPYVMTLALFYLLAIVSTKQPFPCQFLSNISQIFMKDLDSSSEERIIMFLYNFNIFSCFIYRLPKSPLRAIGIFFDCETLGRSFAIGWPRRT